MMSVIKKERRILMNNLCPQCGAPVANGAAHCQYCGAAIAAAQPQPQPQAAAEEYYAELD